MPAPRNDEDDAIPRPRWTRTSSRSPQPYSGTDDDGRAWAWLGVPLEGERMLGERGWIAEYRLAVQDGRIVVAEVRVCPARWADWRDNSARDSGVSKGIEADDVPAGGVTTRMLRRLAVGAHVDVMGELYEQVRGAIVAGLVPRSAIPEALRGVRMGTWPGTGTPATVEELARRHAQRPGLVARVMKRQSEPERKRGGRRPLADDVLVEAAAAYVNGRERGDSIADMARSLKMSTARMRDLVYRARRRGFLTVTRAGTGGGALTREGKALLTKIRRRGHRGRR
jgi:hypothetical protein